MILQVFLILLLVSLSTASVLLFLAKRTWGPRGAKYSVIDLYELYRKDWMPERCEPCFSLWIGTVLMAMVSLFAGPGVLLTVLAIPPIAILFYTLIKPS